MTPTLYQSLADAAAWPRHCSGDRYAGVPTRPRSASRVVPGQIRRQTEIENDDPPLRRHQHVRRLDVSVQFSAAVQFLEAVDELRQGAPKPIDVSAIRDPRT